MKANELMIGDFIRTIYTQKIIKVREVKQSCIYTNDNWYEYNEIEPIPLTPEILEQNGWVYIAEDKVFYSENLKGELSWICYITDGSNEVFRMRDFCNLKYVHQLQHALRLCGIEKTIEL